MKMRKTKHGYCFTAQNKKDSDGLLRLMNILAGEDCEEDPEILEHKDNASLVQLDRTSDF